MKKLKKYITKFFRKIYIYYFNRKYVKESLKARKGSCKKCGSCCYNFGTKCPFLSKDNKCIIYKIRPIQCRIGPIDKQQQIVGGYEDKCGFYWGKKKSEKKLSKRSKNQKYQ